MAQKFKFPMEYLRVTQGQLDAYSHAGSLAMDFGGRDGGADRLYAPCDMVVKRTRQNANGELYLESCEKVLFADGTTDYARLLCMHDGVFNVQQGQVIKQGEYFYDEGGMGGGRKNKFANHVHMEAGKGKWKSTTQSKNSYGTYVIENQASLYDLFILGSDVQLLSTGGYNWKRESEFERKEENCHSEAQGAEESQNHRCRCCPCGHCPCHSERSEESQNNKGSAQPDSVCDTCQSSTAQYDSALICGCPCHSERSEESQNNKGRCCPCNHCPCHSERSEESPAHPGSAQPDSVCDTCQSSTAQYDSTLVCDSLCHSERSEESQNNTGRCCPCNHCPCHSERLCREESQNNKGRCCPCNHCPCHSERSEESPAHPGSAQPGSVCDTSQSSTAQYDSALICGCLCHSERSEESQNNKGRCCPCNHCPCHSKRLCREELPAHPGSAQPGSVCDTSQSSTAQYDSALVCDSLCHSERSEESQNNKGRCCTCNHCTCHSERSEESHNNPGGTLACSCPHTAQLYTENQSLKAIIEKIKQTLNGVNI